jgi:hypothetical protein
MELKIIGCSDSQVWYRDRVGDTVQYLGREGDVYWSRDSGGYRNIVFLCDAVIVDDEKDEQMYKYQNEGPMDVRPGETNYSPLVNQAKAVAKASELEKLFHINDALCDELYKCLEQLTDRLHPVLMSELPALLDKMSTSPGPEECSTKLNSQVQGCNERLQGIIRRINDLSDRVYL